MEMKDNKQLILEMLLNEPDKHGLYTKIVKNFKELIASYVEKGFNFPEIASLIESELGASCNIKSKSLYMAWIRYAAKEPSKIIAHTESVKEGGKNEDKEKQSEDPYKDLDLNISSDTNRRNMFDNR